MVYSIWEGEESGITLKKGAEKPSQPDDFDAVKVKEFEAASWEEACRVRDAHYGWKTGEAWGRHAPLNEGEVAG